jgi:hypothetical protein
MGPSKQDTALDSFPSDDVTVQVFGLGSDFCCLELILMGTSVFDSSS